MAKSIYERLKQDHRVVEKILQEMVESEESDTQRRGELVDRLKQELLAHAHAEEKLLYTELERHKESHDLALEAEEEHHAAEVLLKELAQTDPGHEHWKAKATVLKELIHHHIEEEEDEMFSKAHDVLDAGQEKQLAEGFEEQKEREKRKLQ